jgi:F0F1-type ATP synthase alpha subunit
MQLNPSEISELIKDRIKNFESAAEARTEGTIVSLMDGIARIHGLADVMSGEMIEFPGNTYGMALNLERDSVGAVILGDYEHISEGDTAKCTGRILEVPVGEQMLGRVVNSLGEPIDGKGAIDARQFEPIEKVAPGVIARQSVSARRPRPSPTSCASSRNTAPWSTPSWSLPTPPTRPRCSSSRPTPAAPWASISATAAKTRSSFTTI